MKEICYIYLFVVCLMTLLVIETIQCQITEMMVNNEFKGCGRKQQWPNLEYTFHIQRKPQDLTQDSQCPDQDSKQTLPKYQPEVLLLQPTFLAAYYISKTIILNL
jgi:hypothetical protein